MNKFLVYFQQYSLGEKVKIKLFLYNILLIILAVTGHSCADNALKSEWFDHTFQGSPLKKLLVIGIFYSPEEKHFFEEEVKRQLALRNIHVVPSHTLFEEEILPTKEELSKAVREQKTDFVLIARLVKVTEVGTYYESLTEPNPENLYGYYVRCCQTPVSAGRNIMIETKVFEAPSDKLIWSVISDTVLEESFEKTAESFVSTIIKGLYNRKLIK